MPAQYAGTAVSAPARLRRLVALALAGATLAGCVAPDTENVKLAPTTTEVTTPDVVTTIDAAGTSSDGTTPVTDPLTGEATVPAGSSRIVTLPPAALYDSGPSASDCGGSLKADVPTTVAVTGKAGTPTESLTGVLVNVIVSDAAGPGVVIVWGGGRDEPTAPTAQVASTCDTVVKLTLVPIGTDGTLKVATTTAARVRLDVVGALVAAPRGASGGRLVPLNPRRVLDTAESQGAAGPLPADGQVELTIAGQAGVPLGASAALLQLTATEGTPPGIVTAWATGAGGTDAPALVVPPAGWATSNLVLAPLSSQGKLTLRTTAPVNLTAELVGWLTGDRAAEVTTGLVLPTEPVRVFDAAGSPLEPGYRRDATMDGAPAGVGAALVAASVENPSDAGSFTVYAAGTPRPGVPTGPLQAAGQSTTTPALVRLNADHAFSVTTDAITGLAVDRLAWVLTNPVPVDPAVPPVAPDLSGTPARADFDAAINGFLSSRGLRGASVAVAKEGRLVYARAYGAMDDAGAPVRVDTRFRFASISKVITAAAVLQLVQAGALSLDDSVLSLLADRLPLVENPDPRLGRITVKDLLHHTSGFTKSTDPFFTEQPRVRQVFGPSGPKSCLDAAVWFVTLPLANNPGSTFNYVNMNYCLLSLLVEKYTGEDYDKVVQSLVLERRNVRDARIGASFGRKPDEVAYRAAGGTFLESLSGAGGWLGTSVDLARFLDGLDPDKPGQHLLKPTTYAELTTPGLGSWGLGVEVFANGAWGHTGSLAGARAMAVHQPDGLTWGIVVNGEFENHNEVLRELMGRALGTVNDWPEWDYSPELP